MTKTFNIDLYQSHWRRTHTETFQIEAQTEKEALNKAEDLVKEKGIEENYDLKVQPEPEIVAPNAVTEGNDAPEDSEEEAADTH